MGVQKDILEILGKLQKNAERQAELDKLLLTEQSKEQWITCMKQRAEENSRMYEENDRLKERLCELLQESLDPESADAVFEKARAMHMEGYEDCEILLPVFYRLMEYYDAKEDVPHLLFIYSALYYLENDIKGRREGKSHFDETYNFKVVAYKDRYFDLPYEGGRYRIWVAYYNLIVVGLGNKAFTPDESRRLYQEAMEFWNRPEVQALDGENQELQGVIGQITNEWLIVEEKIEEAGRETKQLFCKTAEDVYHQQMQETGSVLEINSEVYAAYLHAQVLKGERDFESIVDEYYEFYVNRLKQSGENEHMGDEEFYFILNTPLIIGRWLKKGVREEKAVYIMNKLKEATHATWHRNMGRRASAFLNEVMTEWCFDLMEYLSSEKEKEEWLFQLLVRRQLPTYLHSIMVTRLAEALCKEAVKQRPDLFETLPEAGRKDLPGFVRQCALFHDVGKTRITDIVNTQCRSLSDWEFDSIRMHPEYGAQMLDRDEDLSKYRDVALGHHKFYNGAGGYPINYDNLASPYRIITDLITICDCMDAATDHLGRNYKKAKNLDEVIGELIRGKGTRYNPDLVEVMEKSEELQKELNYIVSEGRLDIFYQAYREACENNICE